MLKNFRKMNIQLENKPNCVVMLHVELPRERVEREWDNVTNEFRKYARIPGYRPGRAPRELIASRFSQDIKSELERKLLNEAIRDAIREKNLRVLNVSKVNSVEISDDKTMRFTATLVTSPEFELPDFRSLTIEVPKEEVDDARVEAVIENFREQLAEYEDVEGRPAAMDDFVVVDYEAKVEGQPAGEALPELAKFLATGRNRWLRMRPDTLIEGFCQELVGMNVQDKKTFSLTLSQEFPVESLRGKTLEYEVTLLGIKSQKLPTVDDALAEKISPGKKLDELRQEIRKELETAAERDFERRKRDTIIREMLARFDCELPTDLLKSEMESVLREVVEENTSRGVPEEEIRKHQDELIGAAQSTARDRLRANFLLVRIAEKEEIKVTEQEIAQRIAEMAARYNVRFEKMVKDLRKRNAIGLVHEQILCRKALDLMASSVNVRTVAPTTSSAQEAAS